MTTHPGLITDVGAILFDAGFTLLEPVRPVADLYTEAAHHIGVAIDHHALAAVIDDTWRSDIRHADNPDLGSSDELERAGWSVFTHAVATSFPELLARHADWLERLFHVFDSPRSWKLIQGADGVLAAARARGLRIGIVSNWHSALLPILDHLQMSHRTDFVICSALARCRKPHPAIFAEALRQSGIPAHRTVFVGDSPRDDVSGSLAAGMTPVLVGTAVSPPGVRRCASVADLGRHVAL